MIVRLLILTALYLTNGLSQEENRRLLGKWRSVETSKGGIGAILDFRTNRIFDYSPGAVIGGRYRVEQSHVITSYDNGERETTMTIESLTPEMLRLGPPENAGTPQGAGSVNLKRVGPPEDTVPHRSLHLLARRGPHSACSGRRELRRGPGTLGGRCADSAVASWRGQVQAFLN